MAHQPAIVSAIQQQTSGDAGKPLSQPCQSLLKKILLTIAKGEKSVERQRQILASVSEFEPHVAFQRIDRDQDNKITPIEILSFLRDNGVEDATEADCHFLVNYYANSGENVQRTHKSLDFDEMLQLLMPIDNPNLRTQLAQRPIFAVEKDQNLSKEIEIELTRLFEKEIAFNRVTEELKQRLAASKDFNFWRAFLAIDDWNYGYIDKKNLAIFLKRNGSKTTTSEVMAIIRRLDLDCDARLTFQEFVEGLTPEAPFSKNLKREQMKREGAQGPNHDHVMNKGKMLVLVDQEKQVLRRQALDRELEDQAMGGGRGIHQSSPLKMRPVIVKDLTMFATPRRGMRPKSATNKRFKRKKNKICSSSIMQQLGKFAGGGPINRRTKSVTHNYNNLRSPRHHSKSTYTQNKSVDSMLMRSSRSGRKSEKKLSKKVRYMQGIRALNRQIESSLSRSRSQSRHKRSQGSTLGKSRSRSQKRVKILSARSKGRNSGHRGDNLQMQEKYRSFIIKKFGKDWGGYEQDLDNDGCFQKRRPSLNVPAKLNPISVQIDNSRKSPAFRRSSSFMKKTEITPRNQSSQQASYRKKKKINTSYPFKKSSGYKPHGVTISLANNNWNASTKNTRSSIKKDTSPFNKRLTKKPTPVFLSLRKQSAKKKQTSSGKRLGLNSSFKLKSSLKTNETPRTAQKKGAPQLAFLLQCLHEIMKLEKDCEIQKINLSLKPDFNLIDAFGMLDQQAQGSLSHSEMLVAMNNLGLTQFTLDDAQLIFARFNKDLDGQLKYSDFADAFMPVNQYYARLLGSKRLQCPPVSPQIQEVNQRQHSASPLRYTSGGQNSDLNISGANRAAAVPLFTKQTHQVYMQTWDLIAISERAIESIRKRLSRKTDFHLDQAFYQLSPGKTKNGFITILTISEIFQQFGLIDNTSADDIQLLVNRLDADKDGKISVREFVRGLTPHSTSQACYSAQHAQEQFKQEIPQYYHHRQEEPQYHAREPSREMKEVPRESKPTDYQQRLREDHQQEAYQLVL